MNDAAGARWDALRRAYALSVKVAAVSGQDASTLPPEARPARPCDDLETRLDLAQERAAIMEYCGGLPRAHAEELAYRAHGLPPPSAKR